MWPVSIPQILNSSFPQQSSKSVLLFKDNNLLEPINYGNTRQSQSNDITDPYFLKWCKINWPNDFRKLQERFPICEIILFRHENKAKYRFNRRNLQRNVGISVIKLRAQRVDSHHTSNSNSGQWQQMDPADSPL